MKQFHTGRLSRAPPRISEAVRIGWRRGELLCLRVCDFDLMAGTVRIFKIAEAERLHCRE